MTEEITHKDLIRSTINLNAMGGLDKIGQLFGDNTEHIINELNESLAV